MAEMDERMHELAAKALAGGKMDWQAYVLLHVSEERMRRERELYGEPPEPERMTDFCACVRDYLATDDPEKLSESLSTALSTMSELKASTSGEGRQAVLDTCRRIGNLA